MGSDSKNLVRIGIFYDGHYFYKVSTYYSQTHERKARISIHGLHEFIREEVSKATSNDLRSCQIVDAHYFRGRVPATRTDKEQIYNERLFDDILMNKNIISHYLPLQYGKDGKPHEKGVDVWLALEAYEMAMYKNFDIIALVASDSDYVPLVRKLNTLGTHVMLISWDFEYLDSYNRKVTTRTSQQLLEEVSYPVSMHGVIDDRARRNDALINSLFVNGDKNNDSESLFGAARHAARQDRVYAEEGKSVDGLPHHERRRNSTILNLGDNFGFIKDAKVNNIFFHRDSLMNADFNDLKENVEVEYIPEQKQDGNFVATKVWLVGR